MWLYGWFVNYLLLWRKRCGGGVRGSGFIWGEADVLPSISYPYLIFTSESCDPVNPLIWSIIWKISSVFQLKRCLILPIYSIVSKGYHRKSDMALYKRRVTCNYVSNPFNLLFLSFLVFLLFAYFYFFYFNLQPNLIKLQKHLNKEIHQVSQIRRIWV